jgi:hypothetical protein
VDFEIFMDPNGSVLLELHSLEFSGDGQIHDPETGKNEKVEFSGPLSVAKVEMKTGSSRAPDGQRIPNFKVLSVDYEALPSEVVVSTFGDLPLYKSHKFEDALKNTLVQKNEKIKEDLKKAFQDAENHMWKRFPWNKTVLPMISLETAMKGDIELAEEAVGATFKSEVVGIDDQASKPLRTVYPDLDTESEKMFQMAVDENFFNHIFAFLFHSKRVYGARNMLLGKVSEMLGDFNSVITLIEPLFVEYVASRVIPQLKTLKKDVNNIDVRCDFNKESLSKHMENVTPNEIQFKDGNRLEYDMSAVCGIFIN